MPKWKNECRNEKISTLSGHVSRNPLLSSSIFTYCLRNAKADARQQKIQQKCKEEAVLECDSFDIIIALHY
jgi:hypothetical protein